MRPINRFGTAISAALFALVLVAARLEAQREPGGHTLRDPSSGIRDRAAAVPAPPPPVPGIAAVSAPAEEEQPSFKLFFTPTFGWDDANTRFGAQVKLKRSGQIPSSFAIADQVTAVDNDYRNRIKASTELDLINNKPLLPGLPVFLAALGELSHTQGSGTFAEVAGELDVTLFSRGASSLAVGALGYYDHFSPVDGESDSGFTPAVEALWAINSLLEVDGEYDFNSSFNGEDSFSTRLVVSPPNLPGNPVLILGAAKHSTFTLGVSFSRPLRLTARTR
jgi:hypothetical protein